MSPKTLIVAAALLSATALTSLPAAAAQDSAQTQAKPLPLRVQIMFNLVDVNGDGSIDQAETAALQKAIFTALDADGDGKLSAEEFAKATAGPRERMARFGQWMGRGGPGHHGPRGGQPGQQGQLQPQDFNQAPGQSFGPGGQGGPGPMPMFGEGPMGPPDGVAGGQPVDFASIDTNGDGVISAEEFAAGGPRLPILPQ